MRELLKQSPPKSFRTQKKDYEEHGYSRSYAGCKALLSGSAWLQLHSEACRRRMEGEMMDLEKVTNAKRRRGYVVGKATEMEDANRELEKRKRDDETKTDEEPGEKRW